MGSVSPMALALSLTNHLFPLQTRRLSPPHLSSPSPKPTNIRLKSTRLSGKPSSREGGKSVFMDENGVVDDMDGYLNYLSLEYDSVWDTKPAWCQPWTITLTGVSVIVSSWLILHSALITAVVLFLIGSWWYIFLYSYPKAYLEMIAERRKRVMDGVEDTYGEKKNL